MKSAEANMDRHDLGRFWSWTIGAVLLAISACTAAPQPDSRPTTVLVTHDSLLTFASGGGFDYARAHATLAGSSRDSGDKIEVVVRWSEQSLPPGGPDRSAFLIDAYNALAIASVLNHYPVASVNDIPGYFTARGHRLFGEQVSLDDIEKKKLLGESPDPRIHFAIVCASLGCPPLHAAPFRRAGSLDSLLELLTSRAVNDSAYVQLDFERGRARLSRLFDWYRTDFERSSGSLWQFLARYHVRKDELLDRTWTIEYREYDWSLNQAGATSP